MLARLGAEEPKAKAIRKGRRVKLTCILRQEGGTTNGRFLGLNTGWSFRPAERTVMQ